MRSRFVLSLSVLVWSCGALFAQDLAGTWQTTLNTPAGPARVAIKVTRGAGDQFTGQIVTDQGSPGPPVSAISVEGSTVKFVVAAIGARFEGTFAKDGNSISGTMVQASGATGPSTLTRITPEATAPPSEAAKGK
jgi:hypothetical protein